MQTASTHASVTLPTERTKPVEGIQNYAIYVYGKGGIGKTSFTAQFPNALHLFYEPSGDALSLYAREPKNWEELLAYIDLLETQKEEGTLKFETVIIDVVDIAFKQCIKYVCEPMGVDWPPSDYGKTWNRCGDEFREAIYRLKRIVGVVLVSHATEKNIERLDGIKFDTVIPTITNTGHQVLSKFCGLQACYRMLSTGERVLTIEPNNICESKNRITGHFQYTDGKRIHNISMGASEMEAWKNFNDAYDNKLIAPKTQEESETTLPTSSGNGNINQKTKPTFKRKKGVKINHG